MESDSNGERYLRTPRTRGEFEFEEMRKGRVYENTEKPHGCQKMCKIVTLSDSNKNTDMSVHRQSESLPVHFKGSFSN